MLHSRIGALHRVVRYKHENCIYSLTINVLIALSIVLSHGFFLHTDLQLYTTLLQAVVACKRNLRNFQIH